MELNYIRILTDNLPVLREFYEKKLAFPVRFSTEAYVEFENKGAVFSLFDRGAMEKAIGKKLEIHESPSPILIFAVDNIADEYKKLSERGVIFLSPPTERKDWFLITANFLDPDGNLLEINQSLNQGQ